MSSNKEIKLRPLCNAPSCVLPGNGGIPVSPYSHQTYLYDPGFQLPSQVHSDSNPMLPLHRPEALCAWNYNLTYSCSTVFYVLLNVELIIISPFQMSMVFLKVFIFFHFSYTEPPAGPARTAVLSPPLLLPAFLWSPVYSAPRICLKQWLLRCMAAGQTSLCYPDRFLRWPPQECPHSLDCIQGLHCHGTRICFCAGAEYGPAAQINLHLLPGLFWPGPLFLP